MQPLLTFFKEEIAPLAFDTRSAFRSTGPSALEEFMRQYNPKSYRQTKEGQAKLNRQLKVKEF